MKGTRRTAGLSTARPTISRTPTRGGVLQRVLPAARILLTLRDPIERAYSSWGQNVKARPTTGDRRTFDVAVRDELRDMWRRCTADGELGAALPTDDKRLALDVANGVEPWYVPTRPRARSGRSASRRARARCAKDWRGSWLRWQPEMEAHCAAAASSTWCAALSSASSTRGAARTTAGCSSSRWRASPPTRWRRRRASATTSGCRRCGGAANPREAARLRHQGVVAQGPPAREGSEVPSWSEGVLTELYRDEVRQLRAREPAVVENMAPSAGASTRGGVVETDTVVKRAARIVDHANAGVEYDGSSLKQIPSIGQTPARYRAIAVVGAVTPAARCSRS